jgi:aerobic-type carbon monoxide dehydrogenase small subunit (CoxS/CutS family)
MSDVSETREVRLLVNGREVVRNVAVRRLLADFLREDLGLTATRLACEHGVCGACTVIVDGRSVRSCLMLAVQAHGSEVSTVEGMADGDRLHPLQQAFWEHHALQCGFCTSGFLMTALELVESRSSTDEEGVRQALSGNLCRCTGYANVVAAVLSVIRDRA